jgi:molybdate transport repressor ModE-like protein
MKFIITPELGMEMDGSKAISLSRGIRLLSAIKKHGNLRAASEELQLSYRHAWALLADLESTMGGPLVDMERGKGSNLTELGQALVWSQRQLMARLGPLLDSMASEIDHEISSVMSRTQRAIKMFASHGFAVAALYARLQREHIPVDLNYRGSLDAVNAFSRGVCDIAGFHIPQGKFEAVIFERFRPYFTASMRLVTVASRRQGIFVKKGNPKNIWSVDDLFRAGVRFVNRQKGSGTRIILDLLLEESGRNGEDIDGFDLTEFTHAAVGAYVASGKADAGIGVETGARLFDLDFVPLLTERYFFLIEEKHLTDPRVMPILQLLGSTEFKTEVNNLQGYDTQFTGLIQTPAEAFSLIADAAQTTPKDPS